MNNMIKEFVDKVQNKFELVGVDYPEANQVSLDFDQRDIHAALAYIKGSGWTQLSILTCVDWIESGEFQLVYIVFNWKNGIRIQVRTRIDREKPVFTTITNIYPGAQYYERDVHEFFGVEFEGNADSYKQLFLENWDDIPPLRKDFDAVAYSDRKYPARKYEKDFSTEAGERK
jgi:NADH-quinone oxidoreductase subunit C